MKTVRVAQITDVHLQFEAGSMLYGVDTGATLGRVVQAITMLSPLPDLIIATGDLADDGSAATYQRLRAILLSADLPVYVLAGNHDNIDEMHRSLAGGNIYFKNMEIFGGWAFMFINSKVEDESFGLIDVQEKSELERNLLAVGEMPVLLALHHSPMSICSAAGCQLKNADELTRLAESYPVVRGIIGGHTHTAAEQKYRSHVQYTSPSSFAQVLHDQPPDPDAGEGFWESHRLQDSSHGFRVLDLLPGGEIRSEVCWV